MVKIKGKILYSWTGRFNIINVSSFLKIIYQFDMILIQTLQIDPKVCMRGQMARRFQKARWLYGSFESLYRTPESNILLNVKCTGI